MTQIRIDVQHQDFDPGEVHRTLQSVSTAVGAIVTFTGLVRDLPEARLEALTLEHYPGMTEKSLQRIAAQASARWPLNAVRVIHRVGELHPGDQIVLVAVSSGHRRDAFEACEFIMDFLKNDAPFWKKERTGAAERWVEQKSSDRAAVNRWDKGPDAR